LEGKDHHVALIPCFVKNGNLQSDDGELSEEVCLRTERIPLNISFQVISILGLNKDGIGKIVAPSWLIYR